MSVQHEVKANFGRRDATGDKHGIKSSLKSSLMWLGIFLVLIVLLGVAADTFDWLPKPLPK